MRFGSRGYIPDGRRRRSVDTVNNDDERIHFPDAPKTDLDEAISALLTTAQRVVSAQGRLRSLLDASQAIVQLTDLPAVLRRIAEVALELVDAKYSALGVLDSEGGLEQFIHVGMSAKDAATIGHLPRGHGILGVLIDDPNPIRLEHLGSDPRSAGFPLGHPEMDTFLGVPIRVRGEVYGNIYVTEHVAGGFSEEDQELLSALAATAGIAIDNARLLDEAHRRERWSAATAEVSSALLSDEVQDSLGLIADRVAVLSEADLVSVVLQDGPESLFVRTSRGPLAGGVDGLVFPSQGTISGTAMESGQPVLADSNAMTDSTSNPWIELGPTMAIPLAESGHVHGVLAVSRTMGRPRFTAADLGMATNFATQASVALVLAQGREDKTRVALLEERGRIARDLHDHVIQRLFGAGLGLQSLNIAPNDRNTRAGISTAIAALDASIAEIRTAIFALVSPDARERSSLRHRIIDAVSDASSGFADSPHVIFSGPLDLLVPEGLSADVLAVVRESLANVAKHANAKETMLSVDVTEHELTIEVTDDGDGLPRNRRASGTRNMEARAIKHGGEFWLRARESEGTRLHWRVPLPRDEGEKWPSESS